MLAITDNSAYQICALSDSNECIDSCSSGDLDITIDSQGRNFCGSLDKCQNYILKPNDICIKDCDLNIFAKDNRNCGFCKDIDSDNQYKLLNSTGCLNNITYGTYLYKEKYKLLKRDIIPTTIPTSIISTIPNTILTTIPTTILTTIPTTTLYSSFDPKTEDKLDTEIYINNSILVEENNSPLLDENMIKSVETTENGECPENYLYLYKEINQCKVDCEITNLFNEECILINVRNRNELEQKIIDKIEKEIIAHSIDDLLIIL